MTSLNPSQRQTVVFTFVELHRRMAELEAHMTQSKVSSPFSQDIDDLGPTEGQVVRDYFARIRTTMQACLQEHGIPLEVRRTSVRWTLQCGMVFLQVALAEVNPKSLIGYGPLDTSGQAAVVKMQEDIRRLIDRLEAYLRQGLGQDLSGRLARLQTTSGGVAVFTLLDQVITRWQLIEFRPQLDTIIRRLESPQFEIAVFGRVSSGKSSLLNHIAGMNVLPVGVTPITAVPTRLVRGDEATAIVSFADVQPRRIDASQLGEYASEEGNPGNHKHVTNVTVLLPSPRLREGVVLVDTPGLGSLALAGGAETLAYLPFCDLGVVLIDAGSTLTPDDLAILRTLYEAAVPAQVLLSKADLLTPADRERMVHYIEEQLQRQTGLRLPVHPVSTKGADEALLTHWFERELTPLLERHRALTEASLQRKAAHMRESVVAVLETLRAKVQGQKDSERSSANAETARQLLEDADADILEAKHRGRDWNADVPDLVDLAIHDSVQATMSEAAREDSPDAGPVFRATQQVLVHRGQMAREVVKELQTALAQTLDSLQKTAPLARADPATLANLTFSGLPVPDLSPVRDGEGHRRAPAWLASLLPGVATWFTARALRKRLGDLLHEQVQAYDRRLRSWLMSCLSQLVEIYDTQAEVFRQQVRRLTADGQVEKQAGDVPKLEADLRLLRQSEVRENTGEGPAANETARAR